MRAIEIDSTNNWLYTTIWSQLQEGRFARQIEREIAKDREAMRQEAAERRYERMREER